MPKRTSGGRTSAAEKSDALALRCAAIPGMMHARHDLAWAKKEFEDILAHNPKAGVLPGHGKKADLLANLWFVRAAHEYAAAAANPAAGAEHREYASGTLLPACKAIVQQFISGEGMQGARMDDGGMLGAADEKLAKSIHASPLRLNALWYAAIEKTGEALRGEGPMAVPGRPADPSGDHFERLAGRFRRSFAKAYWCEEHGRICTPESRSDAAHGTLPDVEQVLLGALPASPLPRTKLRLLLTNIATAGAGTRGMKLHHAQNGIVESPLHQAWLVQAVASCDGDKNEVAALSEPLRSLVQVNGGGGIHAYYQDGLPIGKQADLLVTSEVMGTLERFAK